MEDCTGGQSDEDGEGAEKDEGGRRRGRRLWPSTGARLCTAGQDAEQRRRTTRERRTEREGLHWCPRAAALCMDGRRYTTRALKAQTAGLTRGSAESASTASTRRAVERSREANRQGKPLGSEVGDGRCRLDVGRRSSRRCLVTPAATAEGGLSGRSHVGRGGRKRWEARRVGEGEAGRVEGASRGLVEWRVGWCESGCPWGVERLGLQSKATAELCALLTTAGPTVSAGVRAAPLALSRPLLPVLARPTRDTPPHQRRSSPAQPSVSCRSPELSGVVRCHIRPPSTRRLAETAG